MAVKPKGDKLGQAEEVLVAHLAHAKRKGVPVVAPHTSSLKSRRDLSPYIIECFKGYFFVTSMESQGIVAWSDCIVTEISSVTWLS